MINITRLYGASPNEAIGIFNTDADFMPIMKFTCAFPSVSEIYKAKGLYQGHYYWELNLPAIIAAGSSQYVWFNGTVWLWASLLGGGNLFDAIQSPTSSVYPLGTWNVSGEMTSSELISPATGLAKSYFNPSCSYSASASGNMIYFKINGDSYEIPLSKLQVGSVTQTTLDGAITALSTLLTA